VDPVELRRAQQRSADFNRRYGAAIRKVREAAAIAQTQIAGLTDRQLRRIEHGTCRATASALNALAKAHGLDVNVYLDKLAAAMA
jgi:transcriptional regulator with XRE-family HTH domain